MGVKLSSLRKSELLGLMNTYTDSKITESRFQKVRLSHGLGIGNNKTYDVFRYIGTLITAKPAEAPQTASYEDKKAKAAARDHEIVLAAQDIGEIPAVVNPDRREAATNSFKKFCETYFNHVFYLPWSQDHLRVISKIESAVMDGTLIAIAMPRGSGKTALSMLAVIWASLIGAAKFICLIASSAERGRDLLDNIKTFLETNPLLAEDFPEVCYPIAKLERIVHRQKGQRYHGVPTRIEWGADRIVYPTIAGSKTSGIVITCSGMKGSDIRGQNKVQTDGTILRPSLVFIDDPQTRESAHSASQSKTREQILAGDVLGMAGPGKKIAGLMACTVIAPDDMADHILSRDKHPEWKGERTKMVYSWPVNNELWIQYADILKDSLKNDGDGKTATEFYRQNREAMDDGAIVAWPERHNSDELSAIQHAFNIKIRDEEAFMAEYQNDPIPMEEGENMLSTGYITSKLNGYSRFEIPNSCHFLTTYIDVQQKMLFYVTCAWEDNFTGYLIDYGTWPDQKRLYFTLRNAQKTLADTVNDAGLEGMLFNGLTKLTEQIGSRVWERADKVRLYMNKIIIDANWGQSTDVVYRFCQQSEYKDVLLPSHGMYIGATNVPFSSYVKKPGERVGLHWRLPNVTGKRQVRHVLIDTNFWKSFIHERLGTEMGDTGCFSLFGRDKRVHQLLAEHLTAELRVRTEHNGRMMDEWKLKPSNPDNHWLDCLVGSAVGASMCGAELPILAKKKQKKVRVSYSDINK